MSQHLAVELKSRLPVHVAIIIPVSSAEKSISLRLAVLSRMRRSPPAFWSVPGQLHSQESLGVQLILPVVLFHPGHDFPLPPRDEVIIVENLFLDCTKFGV